MHVTHKVFSAQCNNSSLNNQKKISYLPKLLVTIAQITFTYKNVPKGLRSANMQKLINLKFSVGNSSFVFVLSSHKNLFFLVVEEVSQ